MAKLIAGCNITGPDGFLVGAGEDIPDHWVKDHPDEIEDMVKGGAVVDAEAPATPTPPATPPEPDPSTEVPWFSSPPEATLKWTDKPKLGHIKFYDPNGKVAVFHVTEGETYDLQTDPPGKYRTPVWHVEVSGGVATVSPSVHFVGQWHSPNPVKFKIVDKLKGDK